MIKLTNLIFVETLSVLAKILLILIFKNYVSHKQHLQELLTIFYKYLEKNQLMYHFSTCL